MQFAFTEALRKLGPDAGFRLINEARPAGSYVFAGLLPERALRSYEAKDASMTVRSAMAGLVSMDTPYPPTGVVDVATFLERTAKVANKTVMTEQAIRTLQEMMLYLMVSGTGTTEQMLEEVLNFTNAVLIQPHLDVAEWLRGQAIATGAITWTFGTTGLVVDYGIPAGNKLTARAGNDAYAGSTSKFWTDIRASNKLLRGSSNIVRIAHPDLLDDILYNEVNALQVVAMTDGAVTVRRMIAQNGTNTPSSDARDVVTIIKYGLEGEVINPADTATTTKVPFMPRTKLVSIGTAVNTGYVVGAGSRLPQPYEIGYTHLGPTVEAGGAPGRWARVYTPQDRPWQLIGEAAANILPVIDSRAASRIVIATSDVSA